MTICQALCRNASILQPDLLPPSTSCRRDEGPSLRSIDFETCSRTICRSVGQVTAGNGPSHNSPFPCGSTCYGFRPPFTRAVCALQALASKRLQRLFYESKLPNSVGASIQLDTEESKHAARVLRLPVSTEVELYNGQGELVTGRITGVDKSAVSVITTTAAQQVDSQ